MPYGWLSDHLLSRLLGSAPKEPPNSSPPLTSSVHSETNLPMGKAEGSTASAASKGLGSQSPPQPPSVAEFGFGCVRSSFSIPPTMHQPSPSGYAARPSTPSHRSKSSFGHRSSSPLNCGRAGSIRSFGSFGSSLSNLSHSCHRLSLGGGRKRREGLTWLQVRAEMEGFLAEGGLVDRCLREVEFVEGAEGEEMRAKWERQVWALAESLSPPLPAVLFTCSATGLSPLLFPLRSSLSVLSLLPSYVSSPLDLEPLLEAVGSARRAAERVERVVECVSRNGLVRFEVVGWSLEGEQGRRWEGEMKGRTGGGERWRGWVSEVP